MHAAATKSSRTEAAAMEAATTATKTTAVETSSTTAKTAATVEASSSTTKAATAAVTAASRIGANREDHRAHQHGSVCDEFRLEFEQGCHHDTSSHGTHTPTAT
jgi:hypothetical protein